MVWGILLLAQAAGPAEGGRDQALENRVAELERRLKAAEAASGPDPRRKVAGLYSRPFLARFGGNVHLGGYIDLEYVVTEDDNNDTFDQHRLVPFVYADVSEHVKVLAEIEVEHGKELGIEFAHVDFLLADPVNFRAGIILDPLGKFNLVHDAPYQDLALRPLVDTVLIPVVLREPGIGLFGTIDADPWVFGYEAYVVNGFKGLDKAGNTVINTNDGLRKARPHDTAFGTRGYRDFNDNKAVVARISASPFLGFEAGGSVHSGAYDERGNNTLTLWAADGTLNLGGLAGALGMDAEFPSRFEVVGEYALADIGRDSFAKAAGVPGDFRGMYVEGRFHVMPEFLRDVLPGGSDETTFTLVYRYGRVDLDGARRAEHFAGVNFRLREGTVLKVEYVWREEGGTLAEIDNDQVVVSVATYF